MYEYYNIFTVFNLTYSCTCQWFVLDDIVSSDPLSHTNYMYNLYVGSTPEALNSWTSLMTKWNKYSERAQKIKSDQGHWFHSRQGGEGW